MLLLKRTKVIIVNTTASTIIVAILIISDPFDDEEQHQKVLTDAVDDDGCANMTMVLSIPQITATAKIKMHMEDDSDYDVRHHRKTILPFGCCSCE